MNNDFFETMHIFNGKIMRLEFHLARIFKTLKYLNYHTTEKAIIELFTEAVHPIAIKLSNHRLKVIFKIHTGHHLTSSIIQSEMKQYKIPQTLIFDNKNIRSNSDNYWQYKFCRNQITPTLDGVADDVIIINSNNEICETTRANIYLLNDDILVTPPLSCGVLDGTYRRYLLANQSLLGKTIIEQVIKKNEITENSKLFLSNALMGMIPAKIVFNS